VVVLEQAVAGEDLVQVDVIELGGVGAGRLGVLGGERHSHQGGEQNDLDLHLGGLLSGDELMQIVAGRPLLYSGGVVQKKSALFVQRGRANPKRLGSLEPVGVRCAASWISFLSEPRARDEKEASYNNDDNVSCRVTALGRRPT
jgi:hypothetical protein